MKIDLRNLNIKEAHESIKNGNFSVGDLANAYLENIEEKNKDINAYLEIYSDIKEQIEKAEDMFVKGTATLLTGIPIALKDNMLIRNHISSAGSKILENYNATYDSFVVSQLKEQGVIFVGRTNMDEFAMGSSNETSAYGPTLNPLDYTRVPGGSSGGPAAAVAMDGALISLGTDTGGSIRQPASFCNLVGLKPTYGAVSRNGIISLSSSLDQVGPIGKTVDDVEILFNSINSYDKDDSTSVPPALRVKNENIGSRKKVGVPREFLTGDSLDKEVLKSFDDACKKLESEGYEIVDISLPLIKYSLSVYYIIQPAEASSNLARYDGVKYGASHDANNLFELYTKTRGSYFGKEVRRRIMLGTYILSGGHKDQYYEKAYALKKAIKEELENVFKNVDAVLTPSCLFPPFKFGEKSKDPVSMYLSDLFLVPANIAEIPAISVPFGKTSDGLPLGVHIMAPMWREDILFSIGREFEK